MKVLYHLGLGDAIACAAIIAKLAEALDTNAKTKLFYHKYARPNSTDYKYLQKKWEVIE